MKLKLYTFYDKGFFYRAVYIAESLEEAKAIFKEKASFFKEYEIEEVEIKAGVFLEGGGNG